MDKAARIAELKCKIPEQFYKELQQEWYSIETCPGGIDRTKEYSLLIDLLENELFLSKRCQTKHINER